MRASLSVSNRLNRKGGGGGGGEEEEEGENKQVRSMILL